MRSLIDILELGTDELEQLIKTANDIIILLSLILLLISSIAGKSGSNSDSVSNRKFLPPKDIKIPAASRYF